MINLFHVPNYTIDTSRFSNLLHDRVVREFEEKFCEYVGARFACSLNSATSAILLLFSAFEAEEELKIPSIIPTVVPDALLNADCMFGFVDNIHWVGGSYLLHSFSTHLFDREVNIIDSAQKVERNQFANEANPPDLMLFSFYPTKPVGSCDGGMIVSNYPAIIEYIQELSFYGCSTGAVNNWDRVKNRIGHKMYMNSLQAYIANENLKRLDDKKEKLAEIRARYNQALGYSNTSDHLYRVRVPNNEDVRKKALDAGICCGLHYQAAHRLQVYQDTIGSFDLPLSEQEEKQTISLPFHENLTKVEIEKVIAFTLPHLCQP